MRNERLLAQLEKLMKKGGDTLTPAEDAMLGSLFSLVRAYGLRSCPPRKKSTPAETLEFLMDQYRLSPASLPSPANRVSGILSDKRGISRTNACTTDHVTG